MHKLATTRVLIAVAIVVVLGIGVSVQAAGAKPVDPDCSFVPKVLCSPTTKRLPNEPSAEPLPRTREAEGGCTATGRGWSIPTSTPLEFEGVSASADG
jgi:hypothetical protein